jgi:uncharacterized Zn-binding protein involved in type VI secretion
MPGELVQVGATIQCPHGGQATIAPSNQRVKAGGAPVAVMSDTTTVAGCTFTVPGPKPQPCVKVQWLAPALRVKVMGQAVLLKDSKGLCQSAEQIPQGPPNVLMTQLRVKGT